MKAKAVKDGVPVTFTSGDVITLGLEPIEIPEDYRAEMRIAAQHVFGVEITEDPTLEADKAKARAAEAETRKTSVFERPASR
ncbi:MAG: hypothetical protein M3167_06320 [Acidobacteriota bacterium]|nr:hypothetical protein [Acidobacteriota bacterium]MDQ6892279.1 hypothetical protein [Acidobacteriota bacterium]